MNALESSSDMLHNGLPDSPTNLANLETVNPWGSFDSNTTLENEDTIHDLFVYHTLNAP